MNRESLVPIILVLFIVLFAVSVIIPPYMLELYTDIHFLVLLFFLILAVLHTLPVRGEARHVSNGYVCFYDIAMFVSLPLAAILAREALTTLWMCRCTDITLATLSSIIIDAAVYAVLLLYAVEYISHIGIVSVARRLAFTVIATAVAILVAEFDILVLVDQKIAIWFGAGLIGITYLLLVGSRECTKRCSRSL